MAAGASCTASKLDPPETVRGMTVLDRHLFEKRVTLPAIALPAKQCSLFLRHLSENVLKFPGVKSVVAAETASAENEKLILLSDQPVSPDKGQWIMANGGKMTTHEISMRYENYSMNAILKAILPFDEIPTSFETVGHIAHLNLRDHLKPYKNLIGQVLIDKHPHIETVVNKTSSIDETFRTFNMELLAGRDDMNTTVHENGCGFRFDFSKVYWNSRLHTEHSRVIKLLNKGDVLIDVFAGVGPFSVPAAKKGCRVFANDLNPLSYSSLNENSQRNSVSVETFNLDGRDFIREIQPKMMDIIRANPLSAVHIVMNLPAIAIEFLDSFKGFYNGLAQSLEPHRPLVHCYSFSKSATPNQDVLERVQKQLGVELESFDISCVRDVSPNKLMLRITFPLPPEVLWTAGVKRTLCENRMDEKDEFSQTSAKKKCSDGQSVT